MFKRFSALRPVFALPSAAALLLAACGGASVPTPSPQPVPAVVAAPAPGTASPSMAAAPSPVRDGPPVFGEYASRMVVVFPVQRYAVADSGWMPAASTNGRARAAQLDSALTQALRDRGLDGTWSVAPNTSRVAQREVMRRTDPRGLSTAGLVPSRRPNDLDLREPLSSQLRAIIAMVPDSRLVLLPLETRVLVTASGQRQATLRIAFLDGRMATVLSFPDVTGPPAADERAALKAVAEKFADLVIVP